MKKRLLSITFCTILGYGWFADLQAAVPDDYYKSAIGQKSNQLKSSLSKIIGNAKTVSYDGLWEVYKTSDVREDGKIWDMYSNITNYTFNDKCGNYSKEGDCFNREHSVPQSWFSKSSPMVSDAWHVVPTDGKINGVRSNYPLGEVDKATTSSANGFCKLGNSKTSGYSGTVFEPNDLYKGDFARMYFYMATRYEEKVGNWGGGVFHASYPHLKDWTLKLFLKWHRQDPVSQKEIDRNEAIFRSGQKNRNPYIDYPELAELIFGDRQNEAFDPDNSNPNPPIDPEEPIFEVLEPTDITHQSFTANWTEKKNAEDYELKLYTKEVVGEDISTIFDITLEKTIPAGWSKTGYSEYEAGKGWRLASGSSAGSLITNKLNLTGNTMLIVKSKRYGSDTPVLTINAGNTKVGSISYTGDKLQTDTIYIKETGDAVQIEFSTGKDKRLYLEQIILQKGSAPIEKPVTGYPVRTGNVTSFHITGLTELTDYYYVITPIIEGVADKSSDVMKITTPVSNGLGSTYEEDNIITFMTDGIVTILNAPRNANIKLLDMTGKTILSFRAVQEEETITLPAHGIYLLDITHPSNRVCRKLYY